MSITLISSKASLINSQIYKSFQVDIDATSGLNFGYRAGLLNSEGGSVTTISADTILLSDDATNQVYIDGGAVATTTGALPASTQHRLWEVVTASGEVTAIVDKRDVY